MMSLPLKKLLLGILALCLLAACSATPTPSPYPDTPEPVELNAPIVQNPALIYIRFLNELDGWGVTPNEIVRTNDGGLTWYNLTPNGLTEVGYRVHISVLDTNHVWIQQASSTGEQNSGILYATQDGGRSWASYITPFSDGYLRFVDAEHGWMLAGLGAGMGSQAVAVFRTRDGGRNWAMTFSNDPTLANSGQSLPLGGLKNGLTALDADTAWVFGVTYAPGYVYLFKTVDGGENWAQQSLPLPAGADQAELVFDQLTFVSPNDAFLAVVLAGNETQLAVYVSHDAGQTWTLTPTLMPHARAYDFTSSQDAIVYDGDQFYVTRDGAQTWTTVSPDIKFGENWAGMEFVNAQSGWVLSEDPTNGQRTLYRTTDGGASWTPIVR